MNIIVIDDDKPVRDLFENVIRRARCVPRCFESFGHGLAYLSAPTNPADILYLDNHLQGDPRSGIMHIPEVKRVRPDLMIVIATNRTVEPPFVQELFEQQVAFIYKPTEDGVHLEAEITQRVNELRNRRREQQNMLLSLRAASEKSSEGILGLLGIFRQKQIPSYVVSEIIDTNEDYIVGGFREIGTLYDGKTFRRESIARKVFKREFKCQSEYGLSLGLSESVEFLGTKIGAQIESAYKETFGVGFALEEELQRREIEEYAITDVDRTAGIHHIQVLEGRLYRRFSVVLSSKDPRAFLMPEIRISLFRPECVVEARRKFTLDYQLTLDETTGFQQLSIEH